MSGEAGATRNRQKTYVIVYAEDAALDTHSVVWRLDEMRELATVCDPTRKLRTLGAALGGRESQVKQLQNKTAVVRAMHDKLRACGKTQIEYVLGRASLGYSRATHLLRTCGAVYAEESKALEEFDDVLRHTLDRLAPGIDGAGQAQAELCVSAGGLGWRSAKNVALPATVAARTMARPKVEELATALECAGLLQAN
eukprot:8084212-Karenia_brevis.AAC.1